MAKNKKTDPNKGLPNSFLFFLLASIALVFMTQNLMNIKAAKVSFSYQLEHLVNLGMITNEDSRKTALNDNLVTFSGKFREDLSEDSKKRYRFLELLNENHDLKAEEASLKEDLAQTKEKIQSSADWFLHLRGEDLTKSGFEVVSDTYSSRGIEEGVVVNQLSDKNLESMVDLKLSLSRVDAFNQDKVQEFGKSLALFVANMRSPILGIGEESLKQQLKDLEDKVSQTNISTQDSFSKFEIYQASLKDLEGIITTLSTKLSGSNLSQLRSVRTYKEELTQYNEVLSKLDENEMRLEKAQDQVEKVIWFFNNQEISTRKLEEQDPELYHQWFLNAKQEWLSFEKNKGAVFKAPDQPLNTVLEKTFKSQEPEPNYFGYLLTFLPVILVVLVLYFLFSRQMKGGGAGAMNFGKSPAKLLTKDNNKITFKDVAGITEVIEELEEIVQFLKNPHKFTALGGRIPKGVLCVGPPGTGKTLVAKAVAGEADCPFFSISGSDFVEMFVGVGASRIRDMFDQAKKSAPCIIFMDEIDAVGRHRGAGVGGGHDEREQTLNQLLVEMDGFESSEGVILMAATNRPDVLDKALLRAGRFDRQVVIGLPDLKGRFDILKVHAKKVKLDPSVDLMATARSTPGSSGADLANILNEAALLAARKDRTAITNQEMIEAREKVIYGKERRSLEIDDNEKKTTAYHEAGHTIVGLCLEHADPIDKVTIIPRGMSLGATMFLPKKNRTSYWKKELYDQLAVLMGGRQAEEIFVEDLSSGARQDISQATNLARSMVCEWGMSDELGSIAYDERSNEGQYLGMNNYHEKNYSETTAKSIDTEVRKLIDKANSLAKKIIEEQKEKVELMTEMLMEFETLDSEDLKAIMDGTFSADEKKEKLKAEEELHKKQAVTPPPPPSEEETPKVVPPTGATTDVTA